MKKILLLAIFSPLFSVSQENHKERKFDSLKYYERELSILTRKSYDSLRATAAYQELTEGRERNLRKSNNYMAFVVFGGVTHSNFDKFNESISKNGFGPINSNLPNFGIGISFQTKQVLFDIYIFNLGISGKSKKGDETIKFNLGNMWEFDLGYDLLRSKFVSLYPYGGLSFRMANLSYSKPTQSNPNFTDISNLVINNQSVSVHSSRIGYHAGMGFDLLLGEGRYKTAKNILFVKAGVNRPIGGEKFDSDDTRYDPQIKSGEWVINFGIKLGGKF